MMFLAMFRKPMLPAAVVLWALLAVSCSGNVDPLPDDAPTRAPRPVSWALKLSNRSRGLSSGQLRRRSPPPGPPQWRGP